MLMKNEVCEKKVYEKPVLIKHSQLREVTLASGRPPHVSPAQ